MQLILDLCVETVVYDVTNQMTIPEQSPFIVLLSRLLF